MADAAVMCRLNLQSVIMTVIHVLEFVNLTVLVSPESTGRMDRSWE